MPRPSARVILVAVASMLGPGVAAQDREPGRAAPGGEDRPARVLVRGQERPVIDGVLDDAVWASALLIDDFHQVEPVEGAEPSERTEVRLLYDDEFLYVAFRCFDREPDRIIATQMKREASLRADDRVSFVIDPFFDRRNGFFFEMNPAGSRVDALAEDNRRFRKDWDGIWYGRASIDDEGWVAEMAIPFKTISFDPATSRWSFNASRFIRRRNESIRWASPSQNIDFISLADAGVVEGITGITQGVGVDVKPFAIATLKRDHDQGRNGVDVDAGLDVFYKLTPSLTLAATVNTDFAETEVDERQVNLTRFPLFFPEKRDFFLQDAGVFNFGGIFRNPLPFQSRRIGLGPDGETRDILAGVRLTGRVEGLNLGLLDVQMKHDDELGNKNFFVGRASLNVLEQSSIGGLFTFGDPQSPDESMLGGLDFNYRTSTLGGNKVLEANAWAMRSDSTDASGQQSAFGARVSYPNDRINWRAGFTQIDDQFDAALGFVPRRGIREYFTNWRYRWRPQHSWIRTIDSGIDLFVVTNLDDDVESRRLDFEIVEIETQAGDELELKLSREREVLVAPFEISEGVVLPVGDYKFDRYTARLETSMGRPFGLTLEYTGGEFFSGTRDDYELGLEWRVSRHLFLGIESEMNDVDLDEGSFITRLIRGRVNVFFTPDLSWTTFAQFDNVSDAIGVNSRVRWIVEPGNEVFVVLNQAIQRDDSSFRISRTELTTKLGWTFRF